MSELKSLHIHNIRASTVRDLKVIAATTSETVAKVVERAVALLRNNSDIKSGRA